MCKKWISGEVLKFYIGVSDNAANATLALKSDTGLEAPYKLRRARALVESEDSSDDEEDPFPAQAPINEGSAGYFAHA